MRLMPVKPASLLIFGSMFIKGIVGFSSHFSLKGSRKLLANSRIIQPKTNMQRFFSSAASPEIESSRPEYLDTEDVFLACLNEQDVSVKVLSCREAVQEAINRKTMSALSAKSLGEAMACGLLMSSGLKGEESLQINLVGTTRLKNIVVISDGRLRVKGMVGNSGFHFDSSVDINATTFSCIDLLGDEGQVQVIRHHPLWKHPMHGIVTLKNVDIATNLAFYLAESEQRTAVLLTDVQINQNNICSHALALLVESLPTVNETSLEKCIENVRRIQKNRLSYYFQTTVSDNQSLLPPALRTEEYLHLIADECFKDVEKSEKVQILRFTKTPKFVCECNKDRVMTAMSALGQSEIDDIVKQGVDVTSNCGFCGKTYNVSVSDFQSFLDNKNA